MSHIQRQLDVRASCSGFSGERESNRGYRVAGIDRRTFLALTAGAAILPSRHAAARPSMKVRRDPGCGCCEAWIGRVRAAGFQVVVVDSASMSAVKAELGVPVDLASCHTAEVGGYVVEGHIPALAIDRLLSLRPDARGLAAPGMPVGSPGMEVEGRAPDVYDVILFGAGSPRTFMRFRGEDVV